MIFETTVKLPHEWLVGKMDFIDIPILGEYVELCPRAKFKITEMDVSKQTVILRFEVIFHDSNIKNILLGDMDFKSPRW